MKTTLVILSALLAVACAQQGRNVDPRNAAILAEARYLSGDGSFGSAYVQEDGVEFKEETDSDGNRKGQYSYVDPNGKKITVQYTAGKNGFQVSGDHLPKAPVPVPVQAPRQQYQPAPQYNQQPQYNSIPQQQNQFNYNNNNGQYDDGQYRPNQYNNNNNNNNNQGGFQQQYQAPAITTTTPAPRYFPPGKLNLNRTPDGYQYSFSSN